MKLLFPYAETTRGITVRVAPAYLPDQSDPDQEHWVWAYHIRVENGADRAVQLISRHWIITDAQGRTEEVKGAGVVGEQPLIRPGAAFDYVSGCPLATPSGLMRGTFRMTETDSGNGFDVVIPAFSLDSPYARRMPN